MPAGGCALDKLAIVLLFLLLLFPILVNVTNLNVYNILNENRLYLKYWLHIKLAKTYYSL